VYFGGRRVAVLPASGTPLYYGQDMLGTSRVMVEADGTLCYDADFTPFGAEVPYTSNCSQNYKFEGKERDTETANDYFGARYYSSHFGRWLSADWSSVPAPVPYANLTNPQTLNLYAMVSDDPESFADLDGHENPIKTWGNTDGQTNQCKGSTPDDCGVVTAQQTTTTTTTQSPVSVTQVGDHQVLFQQTTSVTTTTRDANGNVTGQTTTTTLTSAMYSLASGTPTFQYGNQTVNPGVFPFRTYETACR
jgi:RHS repeat-associated protein